MISSLLEFTTCVERASIDEAYLDLTDLVDQVLNTHNLNTSDILDSLKCENLEANFVLGHESTQSWMECMKSCEMTPLDDLRLLVGADIVGQMRRAIFEKTGFRCSAGVAHNKVSFSGNFLLVLVDRMVGFF